MTMHSFSTYIRTHHASNTIRASHSFDHVQSVSTCLRPSAFSSPKRSISQRLLSRPLSYESADEKQYYLGNPSLHISPNTNALDHRKQRGLCERTLHTNRPIRNDVREQLGQDEYGRKGEEGSEVIVTQWPTSRSPRTGELAGKCALITGASRGIGKAIAQRFAHEGASCILMGRNEELLKSLLKDLNDQGKIARQGNHRIEVGDVADIEFWNKLKRERVDILVNCAGVAHYSPLVTMNSKSLDHVLQTNLKGTIIGSKTVAKEMIRKRDGCIVNVASLLGLKGGRGSAGYAASKAGVIGFTRALAAELGEKNIRVNVIVPGYIQTDMTEAMTPAAHSEALNAIPLKRFGHPDEVADAAVFLATNKYASNCVLNLDGGLSAT